MHEPPRLSVAAEDSAAQRSRRNPFAEIPLERAAEFRDDDAWLHQHETSTDARFLLIDSDGALLGERDAERPFWLDAETRSQWLSELPATLLGTRGEQAYFALRLDSHHDDTVTQRLPVRRIGLRQAGTRFDGFDAGLFAYASALSNWQREHRFCNRCGGPLTLQSAGHRAQCERCGHLHFPRTDPAIIVIVEHDGACLLGRQASWDENRYSTLAGFVEPGETLEDAVRREVAEESGVEVIDCDYHSSQPWPFPASLMLGFTAHAASRDICLRDGELEDARWFTPEQIVRGVAQGRLRLSSPVSVSWRLLEHWLRHRAGVELSELAA